MTAQAQQADLSVTLERVFDADPQRVFDAWTQTDRLLDWWCAGGWTTEICEVDLRVGGSYRLGMRSPEDNLYVVGGQFSEIDAPNRLRYSWAWEENGPAPGHDMQVTVDFIAEGEKTRLVLTHERLLDEAMATSHSEGWTGKLDNLEAYL